MTIRDSGGRNDAGMAFQVDPCATDRWNAVAVGITGVILAMVAIASLVMWAVAS